MQRADSYFGFVVLNLIDDSNGTKRKQPHAIADPRSTEWSADILSASGRSPLIANRFRLRGLHHAAIANNFSVANYSNAAKLRGQAPFLTLRLPSLCGSFQSADFRR